MEPVIIICVIVVVLFAAIMAILSRYRKCPSDKVLVIYGKVGTDKNGQARSARCIHGGIGVMNIMLVSVTERTREIGLKKALGARKKRILAQFLTEAAVLTSIGGIIGVLTGIGLSQVIAKVAEVPVAISSASIVVSVVFSMVVGIVFGLIPSIKAAKLNPIDALRYE